MQVKVFSIVSLMALISCSWCAVTLYSSGVKVGDRALKDGANPAAYLELGGSYTIFGKKISRIYVSHKIILMLTNIISYYWRL